jgi:hypothetical protein
MTDCTEETEAEPEAEEPTTVAFVPVQNTARRSPEPALRLACSGRSGRGGRLMTTTVAFVPVQNEVGPAARPAPDAAPEVVV